MSLRVVICGGGIAGFATAVGLSRQGHRVHVLESHEKLAEVGSGINIPSNATRVLDCFDVLDHLEPFASPPTDFVLRRYDDGRVLYKLPTTAMTQAGFPYVSLRMGQVGGRRVDTWASKPGLMSETQELGHGPRGLSARVIRSSRCGGH